MKKALGYIYLLIVICSCSNDDDTAVIDPVIENVPTTEVLPVITDTSIDDSFEGISTVKFISTITSSFSPDQPDSFFYNEQGFLVSADTGNFIRGQYSYEEDRLVSKSSSDGSFIYEYDNEGRIISETDVLTGDNIKLEFFENEFISTRFLAFSNKRETYRFDLDGNDRIIRVEAVEKVEINPDTSEILEVETSFFSSIDYEYDADGNIIRFSERSFNGDVTMRIMTYDDKINPYYVSYLKHNEVNYFIDNFFDLNVSNTTGLTPNNVTSITYEGGLIENITYIYDEDNYPVSSATNFNREGIGAADISFTYTEFQN